MSYSLVPYLVDLNDLRRAIGSKDTELLEAVIQGDPDRFPPDDLDESDGEVSGCRALRDLVMGTVPEAGSGHPYGYALERLCDHLGRRLDADMWESIHWEVLEDTGFEAVLSGSGSPVPLPPIDDFPTIGHLTPEQVQEIVRNMRGGRLKTAAPDGRKPRPSLKSWLVRRLMSRITRRGKLSDEDLRELLDEYEGWLRKAAATHQALVFFYY